MLAKVPQQVLEATTAATGATNIIYMKTISYICPSI